MLRTLSRGGGDRASTRFCGVHTPRSVGGSRSHADGVRHLIGQDEVLVGISAGAHTITAVDADTGQVTWFVDIEGSAWSQASATDDEDVLLIADPGDGPVIMSRRSPADGTARWSVSPPRRAAPVERSGVITPTQAGIVQVSGAVSAAVDLTSGVQVPS